MRPLVGTWPATQACALTGNSNGDPLVRRPVLNPLSYTSQGYFCNFLNKIFQTFTDVERIVQCIVICASSRLRHYQLIANLISSIVPLPQYYLEANVMIFFCSYLTIYFYKNYFLKTTINILSH